MSWTDERVETLKKLWTDGLSASQIAAELGGITRNAVIGKVHRLGLVGPRQVAVLGGAAPAQAAHAIRTCCGCRGPRCAATPRSRMPSSYEVEPEPELLDNVIPIGQRRTLLELTEETCRWPIGDPGSADFFFCGGQSLTSLPYCAYHSRVAYQPPNLARPRPRVSRFGREPSARLDSRQHAPRNAGQPHRLHPDRQHRRSARIMELQPTA